MALARIISRSQQCSRELAWELVSRGYAVEIVSPDAIPDNLVDLELRVEADAADQLTATVEARVGGHPASLAFVHRLKAPMGDFVRRPLETSEKVCFPAQPVSFNAEPDLVEDVELPSENWRAPEPARKLEILPDPEERARPITPPEQFLAPAKKPAKHVMGGVTITVHRSKLSQTGIANLGGWFGRAAMTFAAVVVVAIVLGWGIGRGGAVSFNQDSQTGRGTAAAPNANLLKNREPEHAAAAVTVPTPARKSGAKPPSISNEPVIPSAAPKSQKSLTVRPPRSGDDLVAHDTVTYFDKPAKVAPARDSSRRRASSHKQNGGVASAGASPI